MRWSVWAVVAAVVFMGPAAVADEASPADAKLENHEQVAAQQIQNLRTVSRKLRRLSKQAAKAGDADAYATWLRKSAERVDTLARRWNAGIDLYHREFPPESLSGDAERAAHAAGWLAQKNDEFRAQVSTLQRDLLAANSGFDGAPKPSLGRARATLDGMSE